MKDKICLVTGATAGIGEVTALELAKLGARVVILARDPAKAQRARRSISASCPGAEVDVLLADLAVPEQVRKAAESFNGRYPRLDVLINNAGLILGARRSLSAEGHELTFATNHLGPFLLTRLLWERLSASPAARVVNVASDAHRAARLDLEDLNLERRYSPITAYANSKLCNILFTQELSRRLKSRANIVTNALHPGVIATNFGRSGSWWVSLLARLGRPFLLSSEEGAQTTLYLAASEEGGRVSGGYFAKKKPAKILSPAATPENGERLWGLSERLTGGPFPL